MRSWDSFSISETQNSNVKAQNCSSKRKAMTMQQVNLKIDLRHRSYHFSIRIIQFINLLPNKRVFWIIADQLLRCACSIGANIIEAKSSSSRKDFIRFYEIALKSANETKYWLGLLRDATDADKKTVGELFGEVEEISRMLGSSIITLKNKRF